MSILRAEMHWTGATGGRSLDNVQYTAVWLVVSDDKRDQVKTVLDWFEANKVTRGDLYEYAADTSTITYAQKISAKPWGGTQFAGTGEFYWEVIVQYAVNVDGTGIGDDGQPKTNPLDFRPSISARTVQYTRPVVKAKFIDLVSDGPLGPDDLFFTKYPAGTENLTPTNSAFIPLNPPMEKDDSRYTINISRNLATYDASNDHELSNSINTVAFKIDKYGYTFNPIEVKVAKIRDINVIMRRQSGIDYLEVSCALDLNFDTWIHEEVDRGLSSPLVTGAPDGRGGTVDANTPIPDGAPFHRALVDFEERPILEEVLFDGGGRPHDVAGDPNLHPVFFQWGKYREKNFLNEPLLQGIIESI